MKKYVGIGLAVLVLAVLAAGLWYSRPLTIEELCPGIHLEACTEVRFDYNTFDTQEMADCTQSLRLEGEDLPPLLELLRGRKFRRSPIFWPTEGGKTHLWREGDFRWYLSLAFEDVPVKGGTGSGFMLRLDNFFGELKMSFDGDTWRVTTADQEQWVADMMARLLGESAGT